METPAASAKPVDPEEKIRHLPAKVRDAFRQFQTTGNPDHLDPLILSILEDFSPRKPATRLAERPGDTLLMEGLGFDSLTITEIVFFTEDLFGIGIANEELLPLRTLDDLRAFIRKKVTARTTG
jgi:acyl carrier protein